MAGNFQGSKFLWLSSGKHFAKKIRGLANYQLITNFEDKNFRGYNKIRENSKLFIPRKFLAIRYNSLTDILTTSFSINFLKPKLMKPFVRFLFSTVQLKPHPPS